jgi:thiol-disulfide isomerase/thioredoxin
MVIGDSEFESGGIAVAHFTRRDVIGAAAASALLVPGVAQAALPTSLASDPGFRAWTAPHGQSALPLETSIETSAGSRKLGDWLGRRPAVLALWASWCLPCLTEKPQQAALAERLAAAGAATRIFALQAFDQEDVELSDARWMLDRLGANALPLGRASEAAELAFRHMTGATGATSPILPSVFLVGGDGLELGRATGIMRGVDGRTDYWQDEATFAFLSRLI